MKKRISCYCFSALGILLIVLPYGYQMIGLFFLCIAFLIRFSNHRKMVAGLVSVLCFCLLLLEIPILQAAHTNVPERIDYIILLGAGVNGTTPSRSLLDRLDVAAQYLHDHPQTQIIVSGGQGAGEDITEAQAMENYLVRQNIEANRIIQENQASNTLENLTYSFAIIEDRTTSSSQPIIAIITSEYHIYRSKLIAKHLGYTVYAIAAPTTNWLSKINYFLREAPALIKTWLTLL